MSELIPFPTPYTISIPTAYGWMLVNRHDINQTGPLFKQGVAASHDEVALLAHLLKVLRQVLPGSGTSQVFVDVGANVGIFSLGLASKVGPGGKVHAFEPQRIIFNMLAGSIALNSLSNVWCYNMAVGASEGQIEIPQFDYHRDLNFGSIEFGPEQCESLSQMRGHDPQQIEYTSLTTIDRFAFPRIDLMKIDAEGMELEVLAGAEATIKRCRPVLFVEWLKAGHSALESCIQQLGYDTYLSSINLLCIPVELRDRIVIRGPPRSD